MNNIETQPVDRVLRRWGFYLDSRLAFAGIARQSGPDELSVRLIEAEFHAHTTSLPQRIRREQLIRESARADIEHALGPKWIVRIQFEPRKLSEPALLKAVFGAVRFSKTASTNPSGA